MSRPIVDFGQSVRARLLSVAKVQGVQLEYVLLRYALERFLYRLGIDNLVTAGGHSASADVFVAGLA